jgi:hypothetical protein
MIMDEKFYEETLSSSRLVVREFIQKVIHNFEFYEIFWWLLLVTNKTAAERMRKGGRREKCI